MNYVDKFSDSDISEEDQSKKPLCFLPSSISFSLPFQKVTKIKKIFELYHPTLALSTLPIIASKVKTRKMYVRTTKYHFRDRKAKNNQLEAKEEDSADSLYQLDKQKESSININEDKSDEETEERKKAKKKQRKSLIDKIGAMKGRFGKGLSQEGLRSIVMELMKEIDKKQDKTYRRKRNEPKITEQQKIELFNQMKPRLMELSSEQIVALKNKFFQNSDDSLDFKYFQFENLPSFESQLKLYETVNKANKDHISFLEEMKQKSENAKANQNLIKDYKAPFEDSKMQDDSDDSDDSDDDLSLEDDSIDYQTRLLLTKNKAINENVKNSDDDEFV